jgi:acyl-CoA dehydrogenase
MTGTATQVPSVPDSGAVVSAMAEIAERVTGPLADEVDAHSRFPSESIDALAEARLLSALVPRAQGGTGATVAEVSQGVVALGRRCASTAMVVAMHHIQVACLVRHGRSELVRRYLGQLVDEQFLLASATTEIGTGGDVRRSVCAIEPTPDGFRLEKQAPVISYGVHADAVLATARRAEDSPPSDQVLVLCTPPGLELEQTGEWNALGFRGTASPGFVLRATGERGAILDDPYGDISAQTMLPVSHILWSSVWLGIATAAIDRARRYVQAEARKHPGTTPTAASRLAEVTAVYQSFSDLLRGAVTRYESLHDDPDQLSSVAFAVAMNSLKVASSTLVVDVVRECMLICGLASYLLESPYCLGRHLRDAMGAALMVNNDRIMGNNAQLLLVHRGE